MLARCAKRGAPPILYGTAWKKEATAELVRKAFLEGFRGVDTACQPRHYEEKLVGDGIAKAMLDLGLKREDVWIQTKFTPLSGQDPQSLPYNPNSSLEMQVRQSVAQSLSNLKCAKGYLDSLLLHSPLPTGEETLRVWATMEELQHTGVVKQIGISNLYSVDVLQSLHDLARVKPAVVQNRFYEDSGYDAELRKLCKAESITYQSFWTLTANPHKLREKPLVELAARLDTTPAAALFAWLIADGVVPLCGTTNPVHMRDALDASGHALELTQEERSRVRALFEVSPLGTAAEQRGGSA